MQEIRPCPFFLCRSTDMSSLLRGPRRFFSHRRKLLVLAAITASCLMVPAAAQPRANAPSPQQQQQQAAPPAASPVPPAPVEKQAGTLEPNKPVERELTGGEIDVYRIELHAGEFLHVVVQKKGIDVALRLFAPDGSVLVDMYNSSGGWGPVPASLIASVAGSYTLKILPLNRTAAPARYAVSLEPPRQPTASDQTRLAAEQAYVAGNRLAAP